MLSIPIHIRNIRLDRRIPGLNNQQLCGLELLAKISKGKLEGGHVESLEVVFRPGQMENCGTEVTATSSGSACVYFLDDFF